MELTIPQHSIFWTLIFCMDQVEICMSKAFPSLHSWQLQGAIGSEFKIDASYLSPNVNMAARLEVMEHVSIIGYRCANKKNLSKYVESNAVMTWKHIWCFRDFPDPGTGCHEAVWLPHFDDGCHHQAHVCRGCGGRWHVDTSNMAWLGGTPERQECRIIDHVRLSATKAFMSHD